MRGQFYEKKFNKTLKVLPFGFISLFLRFGIKEGFDINMADGTRAQEQKRVDKSLK